MGSREIIETFSRCTRPTGGGSAFRCASETECGSLACLMVDVYVVLARAQRHVLQGHVTRDFGFAKRPQSLSNWLVHFKHKLEVYETNALILWGRMTPEVAARDSRQFTGISLMVTSWVAFWPWLETVALGRR